MNWDELTRVQLSELLPEALVVVPTGATEQHGPWLATGTDSFLVSAVIDRAVAEANFPRPVIVAPTVHVGVSDHHLPFGGTLSLAPETLVAVLLDIARSISACGGRRVIFLNGHGGNHGPCTIAAAAASSRFDLSVAYADYWSLLSPSALAAADRAHVPGHAGAFETSLLLAIRPELVATARKRGSKRRAPGDEPDGFVIHSPLRWAAIDGHTDDAASATAEQGTRALDTIVATLRTRLTELATTL